MLIRSYTTQRLSSPNVIYCCFALLFVSDFKIVQFQLNAMLTQRVLFAVEMWRGLSQCCRARSEPGGTRWRTGGEMKGKLPNGVGSQYSHATSKRGLSSITQADAHTSAASSRLNWLPRRFEWTRSIRRKTKCGFCACAITFRTSSTIFQVL